MWYPLQYCGHFFQACSSFLGSEMIGKQFSNVHWIYFRGTHMFNYIFHMAVQAVLNTCKIFCNDLHCCTFSTMNKFLILQNRFITHAIALGIKKINRRTSGCMNVRYVSRKCQSSWFWLTAWKKIKLWENTLFLVHGIINVLRTILLKKTHFTLHFLQIDISSVPQAIVPTNVFILFSVHV